MDISRHSGKRIRRWDKLDPDLAQSNRERWLARNFRLLGDFQRELNQAKLDQAREVSRRSGNRRRARMRDNGFEIYSEIQVLVKYGKDCHICKTPIDLKAPRRVGVDNWFLGLHIDHLIPIAKGGADTLENVRPAHALCNLKKGSN
jgi:5-methylcytosine-specific restriction endonuclease McrA